MDGSVDSMVDCILDFSDNHIVDCSIDSSMACSRKNPARETLNLSTGAESSTDTNTTRNGPILAAQRSS